MKQTITLFGLVAMLFFTACDKEKLKVSFKTAHDYTFTLEGSQIPLDLPFDLGTQPVSADVNGKYSANDTRVDKVEEAYLEYLKLSIQDPPTETFSFLNDVYLYISADGLDEVLFASKEDIESTAQEIDLDVNDINFAPYIKAGDFNIRTSVVIDETLNEDVDILSEFQFSVTATPLK
ncbi:hypothetical protein GYB22_05920 [bacterium]|nr:hypothetical protein [bacterium]